MAIFSHVIHIEMRRECSHTIVTYAAFQIYPVNVACTLTSAAENIKRNWHWNRSMWICFVHHFNDPTKVCFVLFTLIGLLNRRTKTKLSCHSYSHLFFTHQKQLSCKLHLVNQFRLVSRMKLKPLLRFNRKSISAKMLRSLASSIWWN